MSKLLPSAPSELVVRAVSSSVGSSGAESEFDFSDADFEKVRALIHRHAGISLNAGKQAMVYSRLSRRLRETSHRSFASYLKALSAALPSDTEWQQFINCLTTNLTAFFREEHHFNELRADLLRGGNRKPRIWCSAASTGEEPYSIAMVLAENLGHHSGARIIATDIDTQVLVKARRGVYEAQARGLSAERLQRHFLRGRGTNQGAIRVKPELASMVDYRPCNLMDSDWSLGEAFDIIFCRNVMIYFDAATQRGVLERMHRVLKPGGLLYVGHSENFTDSRDIFRLRGKTIYERV